MPPMESFKYDTYSNRCQLQIEETPAVRGHCSSSSSCGPPSPPPPSVDTAVGSETSHRRSRTIVSLRGVAIDAQRSRNLCNSGLQISFWSDGCIEHSLIFI